MYHPLLTARVNYSSYKPFHTGVTSLLGLSFKKPQKSLKKEEMGLDGAVTCRTFNHSCAQDNHLLKVYFDIFVTSWLSLSNNKTYLWLRQTFFSQLNRNPHGWISQ